MLVQLLVYSVYSLSQSVMRCVQEAQTQTEPTELIEPVYLSARCSTAMNAIATTQEGLCPKFVF